jgi:non-homologous end joining protein Ku
VAVIGVATLRLIDHGPWSKVKPIGARARPKGENVVDLMDALKRSIANDRGAEPAKGKKPRKAAAGQKEIAANQW